MNLGQQWKPVMNYEHSGRHVLHTEQVSFIDRSIPQATFHSKGMAECAQAEEMLRGRDPPPISQASSRASAYPENVHGTSFSRLPFSCQKCRLKSAKEPVITCCGHVFCWPCLYQSISRGVGLLRGKCPTCQSAVDLFRPTSTVISINHECDEVLQWRPGWVPSRPKAKGSMTNNYFPYHTWLDTYKTKERMSFLLNEKLYTGSKAEIDDISLEIERRLEKLSQWVKPQQKQDYACSSTNRRKDPSKIQETLKTTMRPAITSTSAVKEMPVEEVAAQWLDHVYSAFKDHAVTAISNVNELNQIMKNLYTELEKSHSTPCFRFSHAKLTPLDHDLPKQLGVRNPTIATEEVPIQSVNLPSQTANIPSLPLPFQEGLIGSSVTRSMSSDNTKSVDVISHKRGQASIFGYHSLATYGENENAGASPLPIGKKKIRQYIMEFEKLKDHLISTMHANNEYLLGRFKSFETLWKSILMGLLDGWQWANWGYRDIDMNDTQKINRQLDKLSDDWIEVVGRDFTHALGPLYFPKAILLYKPSPTIAVGSHLSSLKPSSTFFCNICGKVNDAIKEPVVGYCGHLFCWDCLCLSGPLLVALHARCPVCNCLLCCGNPGNTEATIVPVRAKTEITNENCSSNKGPCWPASKRFEVLACNENIKLLRMTTTEITRLVLIREEETKKNKMAFETLKEMIKLAPCS